MLAGILRSCGDRDDAAARIERAGQDHHGLRVQAGLGQIERDDVAGFVAQPADLQGQRDRAELAGILDVVAREGCNLVGLLTGEALHERIR